MSVPRKRIAIVGGGPSGMMAMTWLKKEDLEPVCFEKTAFFCGSWNYHDEEIEGLGSVMWTTIVNHSKEMGSFSDKPPKEECPNYMRHFHVLEMFKELANDHDLMKHILYNHEVIRVSKTGDYEATGRWVVRVRNNVNGEVVENIFDGVLVCIGHNYCPKMVKFPGMEEFKGKIMHTHSLKKVDEFKNQRVVVVGIGCSGLDAAVEISNVAKQVFLSTRSGAWIFPRIGPNGIPFDYAFARRSYNFVLQHFPIYVANYFIEYFLNRNFNHSLYNLRPKHHALCKDPSVSDYIAEKLITGSVVIRKNIKYFSEQGVVFCGEEDVTEIDSVILATGYVWKFPFLEEGVLTTELDGRINLYKCMYPVHLRHPTLAILSFILTFGAGLPAAEMQCRWAARLLAGKGNLPSKDVMISDAKTRHENNLKRYTPSDKMSIRVDVISYVDSIASEIGAKPNFFKMAFTDPKLFIACVFGPCLPYQFRLVGPHSWSGAREALLTAHERMKKPLLGSRRPKKCYIPESFLGKYFLSLLTTYIIFLLTSLDSSYYLIALFVLFIFYLFL